MKMPFPKLKLTYLDLAGRAEAARLAFFIGGVPFEDVRLSRADLAQRKHEFPYSVVPVLQVDDEVLAESSAIARYAGRLAGLYPTNNPIAAMMVDEVMLAVDELGESFRPWFAAQDQTVRETEEANLLHEVIPKHLTQIDTRLAKIKEHVTFHDDSRLFLHELWVYQSLRTVLQAQWLAFVPNDIHKDHTHWVATETKVENHPRVREWNALQPTRPTKLKLTYFDFGGRAEPIRLAFHWGGIEFEDHRLPDREAAIKLAPTLPFGSLPTLAIDDNVTIGQSFAMLRYAGSLAGLYPTNTGDRVALRIDELLAVLAQLEAIWYPALAAQDPETQRVLRDVLVKETIPHYLGGLDKRVSAWATPYATGEKPTIADLAIFCFVEFLKSGTPLPATVADGFPALLKIHALVRDDPRIVAYYDGRVAGKFP